MKSLKLILTLSLLTFTCSKAFALDLPSIKLELAKLESQSDKALGAEKCNDLLVKINQEQKQDSAEFFTWRGIILAKLAHYNAPNPKALGLAKEAKNNLEKAVEIDEKNSDAAALNALGILYHRVPKFISFGDDKKSEEYFKRAIQVSSNLDTNWRYGEFLIEKGRVEEGLNLLKTAVAKADQKKADEKIKQKIIQELIEKNDSK